MKNIETILSELGISVPDDKKEALGKAVTENYKTVAEFDKQATKLANMTTRAETAEETLKGFEGKDFDAITRERDAWRTKHEELVATHQREKDEQEFNDSLSAAISTAKGKNSKAISALLDLDALRGSKNRDKDIQTALEGLRAEHGYLFEDNGGNPYFDKGGSGGDRQHNGGKLTRESIMAMTDRAARREAIANNQHLFR